MSEERRRFIRTAFPGEVRLIHPGIGELVLELRDVSEGGVYLYTAEPLNLAAGEAVQIQSLDMDDAPLVSAFVVRCEPTGIALSFESQ